MAARHYIMAGVMLAALGISPGTFAQDAEGTGGDPGSAAVTTNAPTVQGLSGQTMTGSVNPALMASRLPHMIRGLQAQLAQYQAQQQADQDQIAALQAQNETMRQRLLLFAQKIECMHKLAGHPKQLNTAAATANDLSALGYAWAQCGMTDLRQQPKDNAVRGQSPDAVSSDLPAPVTSQDNTDTSTVTDATIDTGAPSIDNGSSSSGSQ